MGALDNKIHSGVTIIAALLFVVSAAMLFIGDAELAADHNSTALYILTVAGILAILFSVPGIMAGESFVRKISSILVALSGVLFLITAFVGESASTVLGVAGIVAGLALVTDMLALWVSRIYGAMYVSAILAAVDLVMGAMCLIKGYAPVYALGMLIAFAVWFVVSSIIGNIVPSESATKTREIIESKTSQKKEKPQAQNKKATLKAKKVESKKTEAPAASEEAPKTEEKPEEVKKVRTVQLPKTPAAQAAIEKTQEAPKTEAPKQEQKAPAKAMGDFMEKLMTSSNAKKAAQAAEEKPAKIEEPVVKAPEVEKTPAQEDKAEETSAEEAPAEEEKPVVPAVSVPSEPYESVIAAPVEPKEDNNEFHTAEPNWGLVSRDASGDAESKKPVEEKPAEPAAEEKPVEKVSDEPAEEAPAETPVETPAEEPVVEEKPVEPVAPAVSVPSEPYESVISAPVETPAQTAEEPAAEPNWDVVSRDTHAEETQEEASDEESEDVYTDNSPEALVRRAAWNKGLRCRRGYGPYNIPVAFVKYKVAVFVDDAEPDKEVDEALAAEGWTVLRFKASDITDGKEQGEAIHAATKSSKAPAKKKKAKK